MKKAFTVYVPDGCHLKMLNATIFVEKNDGNENGLTVFTQGENDITENNDWLFQLKGNAIRVSEVK